MYVGILTWSNATSNRLQSRMSETREMISSTLLAGSRGFKPSSPHIRLSKTSLRSFASASNPYQSQSQHVHLQWRYLRTDPQGVRLYRESREGQIGP